MDELNPRRLTRQQLSQFLPTHELVKAFEALFKTAGSTPDEINALIALVEEVTMQSESASAGQHAIEAQLSRMASALETISLAPAVETRMPDEVHVCPSCSALQEEFISLTRRVTDLESAP